jgi:Holliday junction resolvase RusA-like endonuclease
MISFYANGIPKGQPRPKAFSRGGRASVYDPSTAEGWKSQVAMAAKEYLPEKPLTGPLRMELYFYFPRPKGHFRTGKRANELRDNAPVFHVSKPDSDNLAKAVMDAMTQLGFWMDDSQVARLLIQKEYSTHIYAAGCRIKLTHMKEPHERGMH